MDNQIPLEEKKPERIDELDVIGGGILKIIVGFFGKIRNLFTSRNAS